MRENSGDRNSYDRDTVYVRCKCRKLSVAWCMPKVGFPLPLAASSAAVCSTLPPQTIFRYKRNLSLLSKIQSLFCLLHGSQCLVSAAVTSRKWSRTCIPFHDNTNGPMRSRPRHGSDGHLQPSLHRDPSSVPGQSV